MENAVNLFVPMILAGLALAPVAQARVCAVSIDSTDQMSFSSKEIKVAGDCSQVKLTLRHTGKLAATAMGHNWVLLTPRDDAAVLAFANAAATRMPDYLPEDKSAVLAHTKILGGGETDTIEFTVPAAPGAYPFLCTLPGHAALMRGQLIVGP